MLIDPCSPVFALGAKSRRARVLWVPTTQEDGRVHFPEHLLVKAMRGARLLAFADPGNPTGGSIAPEDFERIAWFADRHDVLLYVDETFARFLYDGPAANLATMPGAARRVLVAGSATAGYGLGSARVGWLTGPRHLLRACALTANLSAPYPPVDLPATRPARGPAGRRTFRPGAGRVPRPPTVRF